MILIVRCGACGISRGRSLETSRRSANQRWSSILGLALGLATTCPLLGQDRIPAVAAIPNYRYVEVLQGSSAKTGLTIQREYVTGYPTAVPLPWNATVVMPAGSPAIALEPNGGVFTSGPTTWSQLVSITVNATGTAQGSYHGRIEFRAPGPFLPDWQWAPGSDVTLVIDVTPPPKTTAAFSPSQATLTVDAGQSDSVAVQLSNTGDYPLVDWKLSASTENGISWLGVSPSSGTTIQGRSEGGTTENFQALVVAANASGLIPSEYAYRGTINLSAQNLSAPRQLPVSLYVREQVVADDLSISTVTPEPGTPVPTQTRRNFQAQVAYALRTRPSASLLLSLYDQNDVLLASSEPQSISQSATPQTAVLTLPAPDTVLKLSPNVTRVRLRAVIIAGPTELRRSSAGTWPVVNQRINQMELGMVPLFDFPVDEEWVFLAGGNVIPLNPLPTWIAGLDLIRQSPRAPKVLQVNYDLYSEQPGTLTAVLWEKVGPDHPPRMRKLRQRPVPPGTNQKVLLGLPGFTSLDDRTRELRLIVSLQPEGGDRVYSEPLSILTDWFTSSASQESFHLDPGNHVISINHKWEFVSQRTYTIFYRLLQAGTVDLVGKAYLPIGLSQLDLSVSVDPDTKAEIFAAWMSDDGKEILESSSDRLLCRVWAKPVVEPVALGVGPGKFSAFGARLNWSLNSVPRNSTYQWSAAQLQATAGSPGGPGQAPTAAQTGLKAPSVSPSGTVVGADDFQGLEATWHFDPAIPADGTFAANLTLDYRTNWFLDNPNFQPARLQIVSFDPSTGIFRRHDTVVDASNQTATTHLNHLAAYYTLGVFEPFPSYTLLAPFFSSSAEPTSHLTLVNLNPAPARLTNLAYKVNGQPFTYSGVTNPAVLILGPARQESWACQNLFGLGPWVADGWIQVRTDSPAVFGIEWIQSDGDVETIPLNETTLFEGVLTEVTYQTNHPALIHLVNPAPLSASVELDLWSIEGTRAARATNLLRGKSKWQGDLTEIYPDVTEDFIGYLTFRSDQAIRTTVMDSRPSTLSVLPAQPRRGQSADTSLAVPGFARDRYSPTITLVNPGTQLVVLTLQGLNPAGQRVAEAMPLPLFPQMQMPPLDLTMWLGLNPTHTSPTTLVLAEDGAAGTTGHLTFSFNENPTGPKAILPLDLGASDTWLFSHVATAPGWFTDVSVFNPNPTAVNLTTRVYSTNGSIVASHQASVPARGTWAPSLGAIIPGATEMDAGYFSLQSDQSVVASALFGKTNRTVLSALRGQKIDRPSAAPPLMASVLNRQVLLRWPRTPSHFELEATPSLHPPIQWSPVTNTPSLNGEEWQVTLPPTGSQFLRLRRP